MHPHTNNTQPSNLRILFVDDEPICALAAKLPLLARGYKVVIKERGRDAIDYLLKKGNIGLILLDYQMPEMNGLEVLKELKSHPILQTIPVILQTGTWEEDILMQARDLGIKGALRKPYSNKELIAMVEEAMPAPPTAA